MKELDQNLHRPMPKGKVFCGSGPLHEVRKDLLLVAGFLQSLLLYASPVLSRYDDWWEHDGLHFKKGRTDLHSLFSELTSARQLLESMSDDDHVFTGLGPEDESWYLRYRADWDSDDDTLVAAYAIAFVEPLAARFREEVVSKVSCVATELDTEQYFARICNGECSL